MDTFLDILTNHPHTKIGTEKTFVLWRSDISCFEIWKDGIPAWMITFSPDLDPLDVERDVAIKLWQALEG